jgi:hypothetical protein
MSPDDSNQPSGGDTPAKRQYTTPVLVTYGDAAVLTPANARGGRSDGATQGKSRTS